MRIIIALALCVLFSSAATVHAQPGCKKYCVGRADVVLVNETNFDIDIAAVVHKPSPFEDFPWVDPVDGVWKDKIPKKVGNKASQSPPKQIKFTYRNRDLRNWYDWWFVVFSIKDAKGERVFAVRPINFQKELDIVQSALEAALITYTGDQLKTALASAVAGQPLLGLVTPVVTGIAKGMAGQPSSKSRTGFKAYRLDAGDDGQIVQLIIRQSKDGFTLQIKSPTGSTRGKTPLIEKAADLKSIYTAMQALQKTK